MEYGNKVVLSINCYAYVYKKGGRAIHSRPSIFGATVDYFRWKTMKVEPSTTEAQLEAIMDMLKRNYAFIESKLDNVSVKRISDGLMKMRYEGDREEIYLDSLVKGLDEENDVELVFYLEVALD